ncbi:MAG: zf-HC2 domain-containing protein [Microbacteriaceae bacterium]
MTANCEKAKQELEEYLHNELCKEDSADIREHIENCPDCAADLRIGQVLSETVQRAHQDCAPEQLREDLMRRLRAMTDAHEAKA